MPARQDSCRVLPPKLTAQPCQAAGRVLKQLLVFRADYTLDMA